MGLTQNPDSYIDLLFQHLDHSNDVDSLVHHMRTYAENPDNADTAAISALADTIDENLKGNDGKLPGSGPLLPGLVLVMLGLKDDPSDKHKKLIKRLVDAT